MTEFRTVRVEFLKRWRAGRRPSLREVLTQIQEQPAYVDQAMTLAGMDLNERLRAGDEGSQVRPVVAALADAGVTVTSAQLLKLVRIEFEGRWSRGERISAGQILEGLDLPSSLGDSWRPRWACPRCGVENSLEEMFQESAACSGCKHIGTLAELFPARADKLDHRSYELADEPLGIGGMGQVFQSQDPGLGRQLVVKVLNPELHHSPSIRSRFEDEARIMARLQHPGIPPVYNRGRLPDGRLFYSMKRVDGDTLEARLERRDLKSERDRDQLISQFAQVCQTMAYAHQERVIHRDLKPANIMVGEFGEVQVMDWGLSKQQGTVDRLPRQGDDFGRLHTNTGAVLGTLLYMAPEQAVDASQVEPQADVYSLGAILCEILTGAPPILEIHELQELRALQKLSSTEGTEALPARQQLARINEELKSRAKDTTQCARAGLLRLQQMRPSASKWRFTSSRRAAALRHPIQTHLLPLVEACLARPATELKTAESVQQGLAAYYAAVQETAKAALTEDIRRRRTRIVASLLAVLLVISSGAAGWIYRVNQQLEQQTIVATDQKKNAEDQREIAQRQEALAKSQTVIANAQRAEADKQRATAEKHAQDALKQSKLAKQRLKQIEERQQLAIEALSIALQTDDSEAADKNTGSLLNRLSSMNDNDNSAQIEVYHKALMAAMSKPDHKSQLRLTQALQKLVTPTANATDTSDLEDLSVLAFLKSAEADALLELKQLDEGLKAAVESERLLAEYQSAVGKLPHPDKTHNSEAVSLIVMRVAFAVRDCAMLLRASDTEQSRKFAKRAAVLFLSTGSGLEKGAGRGLDSYFLIAMNGPEFKTATEDAMQAVLEILWLDDTVAWIEEHHLMESRDANIRNRVLWVYVMRAVLSITARRAADVRRDAELAAVALTPELAAELKAADAKTSAKFLTGLATSGYTALDDAKLSARLFDVAETLVKTRPKMLAEVQDERVKFKNLQKGAVDLIAGAREHALAGRFQEAEAFLTESGSGEGTVIYKFGRVRILALLATALAADRKSEELPLADQRTFRRYLNDAFSELDTISLDGIFTERLKSETDFRILRNDPRFAQLLEKKASPR